MFRYDENYQFRDSAACSVNVLHAIMPGADVTHANIVEQTKNLLTLPAPKDRRLRPLVVILADNAGTETTDFVIPYGVLKESGAADVVTVSTEPGTVELMPALRSRQLARRVATRSGRNAR